MLFITTFICNRFYFLTEKRNVKFGNLIIVKLVIKNMID